MKYNEYRAIADRIRTKKELDDFLEAIENDFYNISDKQYYDLKHIAIDIYYASMED